MRRPFWNGSTAGVEQHGIPKRLVLVLGTLDPELQVAACTSEEAPTLQDLTLDVVLGWGVMSRPHLPPLVAMPME